MNFTIYRSKNTIEKRRKIYLSELHKNLTHEKEQVEIKQTKVEKSNTTKSYNSEDEITIAMCTQPHRKEQMLNVVKQLLPQCSRFCICFNNYDKIPEELPKSDKLICISTTGVEELFRCPRFNSSTKRYSCYRQHRGYRL